MPPQSLRKDAAGSSCDSLTDLLDFVDSADSREPSVRAYRWHSSSRHGEDSDADSGRQPLRRSFILESEQWRWESGLMMLDAPEFTGEEGAEEFQAYLERVRIWVRVTKDYMLEATQVVRLLGALSMKWRPDLM